MENEENMTYLNEPNTSATDRAPGDGISPRADASDNPFEENPDDSTDITAPYDEAKAEEIESQLV